MAEPAAEAPKEERASRMKGRAPYLIGGALLILLVGAALWYRSAGREATDDAQIDGHVSPVAARVAGTVTGVFVSDNQVVGEGAVLVHIDPRDYETALARARAELADAEAAARAARENVPMTATTAAAGLEEAGGDLGTAQAHVAAAQAQVEEARANEVKAARDLERYSALLAKDEVSRQEHDRAAAEATAARARRESAEAALREAGQGVHSAGAARHKAQTVPQQVHIARAQADVADARVLRARAALDQALLNRQYTELKAPVAGIISRRSAEVGQVVQAGQALMAVVPLEDVWITANFKETQLKKIRVGQPVTISVDAYGGREYRGHVDSIAAATGARFSLLPPENATGNFVKVVQRVPVKIVIDKGQDREHLLRPGLSVTPTIHVRGN